MSEFSELSLKENSETTVVEYVEIVEQKLLGAVIPSHDAKENSLTLAEISVSFVDENGILRTHSLSGSGFDRGDFE